MDCAKCGKSLKDCKCPDIDKRMADLRNNPYYIYKMCEKCGKHHERCQCGDPKWITSHDGLSLEEVLGKPTLADILRSKMVRKQGRLN